MSRTVRVAAVQAAPAFLDREASIDLAVAWIGRAAAAGAGLVAFGESWIPGYPAWLDLCPGAAYWDYLPAKRVYARLLANAVGVPGEQTDRLAAAARDHAIVVVIGVHERVATGPGRNSLYNTQIIFGTDGAIALTHRKLVPTFAERLVWAPGDGAGLESVDTPVGRVGTLICWEHWMPLARQALHESAEQIHVAAWPTVREMYQIASRHYAFEGRCFVLAVGSLLRADELPSELELPAELQGRSSELIIRGGSCIIGPDGGFVIEPVFDREELLIADLDLDSIAEESLSLDVTGHYSRPDLFEFRRRR